MKKTSIWNKYILNRIEQNKNFLCAVVGGTGSGKSYSVLRVCEELDPEFNIDRVIFSPQELLELLESGSLKKGSCISIDEAGVVQYSRNWQSVTNKLLNYMLQTIRSRNLIMFFCTPSFTFLDSHARTLFHALWTTKKINFKQKVVYVEPKGIQVNNKTGKAYYKYLRVKKKWSLKPVKLLQVGLPSKKLMKAYESKKDSWLSELNTSIQLQLNKEKKVLTDLQQQAYDLRKSGMEIEGIASKMGVSERQIYKHLSAVKRKGFEIEPEARSAKPFNSTSMQSSKKKNKTPLKEGSLTI